VDAFARRTLDWYDRHGRKDLPWHRDRTPYGVWISEVMLQQTQVATVIPYYETFMARFPNVATLARADLDAVLALWTGLGYYARARNLHAAAARIAAVHGGELPDDLDALMALPGIGRSTAGAIYAAAFGKRAAILDGNVKRLLARFHAVSGYSGSSATANALWQFADSHTPMNRVAEYTQAVMDLGAMVCKRGTPQCDRCPHRTECTAYATNTVANYPQPRPRRDLPAKRCRMYLLTDHNGRCLLEKRPPTGIWGGLWNPIERPIDDDDADLLTALGLKATGDVEYLTGFRHTFTHFHLDVEPVRVPVCGPAQPADGERYRWYGLGNNEPIGLSRVAVRLLAMIAP
jgi:A/G-specific adenine glycosylase